MDDFGRVAPLGVAVGHHQPGIGQFLHKLPATFADFAPQGEAAGVFGAIAGAHQLDKYLAGKLFVGRAEATVLLFGVASQCAINTADGIIRLVGELAEVLPLPQGGQGKFEQGQIARLTAHVVQNTADQPRFELYPLQGGGFADGLLQRLAPHRPQNQRQALNRL